eukprot:gene28433-31713_t
MQRHLARGRALSGRTGCGLCGISDLSALPQAEPAPRLEPVALAAIHVALGALEAAQPLNAQTRAVHAAAFANLDGHIVAVREDVGRHNALDKLIGALLRGGQDPADGFIVITSRCSFEMVEKAARSGAHTLVAISAPTSLAIERAQRYGLTLVALARSDSARIFNGSGKAMTEVHETQLDKLIRMANQIAVAFDGLPEDQAVRDTAEHIIAFWTPKMRRELGAYVTADGARLVPRGIEMTAITDDRPGATAPGLLDRERIIARAGFNRWLVPPAALAIHLCIGMAYGFSVFWLPLSRSIGITASKTCADLNLLTALFTTTCDWRVLDVNVMYTLFFVFLGSAAAIWGGWLERVGPRRAGVYAAFCWCG